MHDQYYMYIIMVLSLCIQSLLCYISQIKMMYYTVLTNNTIHILKFQYINTKLLRL